MAMNVKFLRGVIAGYNAAEKNADTLYFCTDGALYLGSNLIADKTDLTTVNAAIKALQDAGYQNADQVSAAISAAITAANLDQYAKTEEIQSALDKANSALQAADLADYAKTADVVAKTTYEAHLTAQSTKDDAQDAAIKVIADDYLKAADKTELADDIADVQTAVNTEKTRAEGIEAGLRTDVNAIKGDYLKAADKTALQNNINAVSAVAEAATTVAEVDSQIDAKITALNLATTYEAKGTAATLIENANLDQYTTEQEVKDIVDTVIAGAVEGDTLEGLVDLVEYINTHGGEAAEMASAIEALEGKVGTIEGKPAYGITATQIANWDDEVGAKALAETKTTTAEVKTQIEAYDYATKTEVATAKQEAIDAAAADSANKDVVILASAQEYVDSKVGVVPEDSTVMGIITNIQENAYDDTELRGLIDDKQDALTSDQLAAVDSGINATKVATYDGYAEDIAKGVEAHDWGNHADAGYLTEHQDISNLATKEALTNGLAGKVDNTTYNAYVDAHKNDYDNDAIDAAIKVASDAAAAADAKAVAAQGEVDALETVVANHAATSNTNFEAIQNQLTWGSF